MFMDFDTAIVGYQQQAIADQFKIEYHYPLILGTTHESVSLIRKILYRTGELSSYVKSDVYDQELYDAIISFQKRFTLSVDGIIGKQTIHFLNLTNNDKIQLAELSKKVWDNIPEHTGKKIVINVPGFECWAFDNDVLIFKMKCIVGRQDRRTPIFSDSIKYAVFRPYWHVPSSIFSRDKLPKILKYGPSYLTVNQYEVIDNINKSYDPYNINWESYKNTVFRYQLRQKPGENNALGLVKFMFPNKHSVYMHDTPNKELFEYDIRAQSSGCIRLEDPVKMASFLLDEQDEKVINMMTDSSKDNNYVQLEEQVPVHITYMTSWIEEDTSVRFAPDVYRYTTLSVDDYYIAPTSPRKKRSEQASVGEEIQIQKRIVHD